MKKNFIVTVKGTSLLLQKLSDVQFLRPKLRRQVETIFSEAKRDQT